MKHAIYFEDMCSHEFVVKVGEDDFGEFLEQRVWNDNVDYGGDKFIRYREQADRTRAELYQWIDERSKIVAIANPTENWTDREWERVDSMKTQALRAQILWVVERSRLEREGSA